MLGQGLQHTVLCSRVMEITLILQSSPVEVQRAQTGCSPSLISPFFVLNTALLEVCLQRVGQAGHQRQNSCLPFPVAHLHAPEASVSDVLWGQGRGGRGGIFLPFCFVHSFYIPSVLLPPWLGRFFLMPLGFVLQPALLILSGHILYLAGCLSHSENSYFFGLIFWFNFFCLIFFLCGILISHKWHLYQEIKGL